MSGICGVWRSGNAARAADTLAAIAEGLSLTGAERMASKTDQGAAVGACARSGGQQVWETPRTLVASDADLLNEAHLREEAGYRGPAERGAETAALMARLYERYGCRFVER